MSLERSSRWRFWIGALAVLLCPAGAMAAPTLPGTLQNPMEEPSECQFCHSFPNADGHADQPLYAAFFNWQGSMMANSARDPVFWAAVAIADQDAPGETEDCVRCHAPRAFLDGRGSATSIQELTPADLAGGIECDLCHRMMDDGVTPPGNAQYTLDDVAEQGVVARRGPWDYTDGVPQSEEHATQTDPYSASSAMCGMCHDVSTHQERVDDQGNPLGFLFNEQSTYSEWTRSAFAIAGEGFQSCQDCHMPAVADKAGCESYVEFYAHALGGRRHDLVGPNRFMITLLQRMYGDAGTGDVIDFFFDQAIERTDAFIGTSATLEVDAPAEVHLGEGLSDIAVTVTNETGHKLPTGYSEGRMMWLEVVATYGEQVVWSSGAWDQAEGLQEDAQLRTYQAIAEDIADGTTFHLLRNNHWVEDSRIPPRGLTQDPATDPVGNRYTARPDGTWPHWDQHSYTFAGRDDLADATPNDGQDDALDVRVRLLYLINTPEYVEFLAEANTLNDAGNDVAMLFDTAGGAPPVVVAEQTLTLPIRGFGATAGTTTGDSEGDVTGASDAPATTTPASTADDSMTAADGTETDTAAADEGAGGCSCRSSAGSGWGSALLLLGLFAGRLPVRRRANTGRLGGNQRRSGMIYSSRNATLATTGPEVVSSLARRARHCR